MHVILHAIQILRIIQSEKTLICNHACRKIQS
eukprot:COSAG05_NODE_6406_length_964_cov_1.278613_1_plen_31_part_01